MATRLQCSESEGLRIELSGVVQGVGFRPWVYRLATEHGLTGHVENGARGVTIEAYGAAPDLRAFLGALRSEAPPAAHVETLVAAPLEGIAPVHFTITPSCDHGGRRLAIGPDIATCRACLAEVMDPEERRHRYALTNCTQCGPRWSIALDIPYDRDKTTMASFVMCEACRREYESVADRRFHAQPIACPKCGPRLVLCDATVELEGDPLRRAAELLHQGAILLVKGLGGFHLACDATQEQVVRELRRRKGRDEKPFALMVADLEAAKSICRLDDVARRLLTSVERPIVLLPRGVMPVAPSVAPDSARLGVMLPYSPLHHLLLDEVGRPLVMTSANLADEPTTFRDGPALAYLHPTDRRPRIADYALTHDRPIATRVDDSIVTIIGGQASIVRRSRGWVPRPITLPAPVPEPVLACGAQLKNTVCLAVGDLAYLGPHIGDLDSLESFHGFEEAIDRLETMLCVRAKLIAHDAHPDLVSTRHALSRPGVHVAVQHHHAHIASLLCEHGMEGPVVGVAFDGTGYGTDGQAWGGEVMIADRAHYARRATLRPIPLLGGDRAIREPWRLALALLEDAFEGDAPLDRLPLFRGMGGAKIAELRQLLSQAPTSLTMAHGAGRYFDAFGAIVLGRATAGHEAQLAMALELAADTSTWGRYDFVIDQSAEPWSIDLRPAVRQATGELLGGAAAGAVAMRFHRTLAMAVATTVRALDASLPVAATGGCFQNAVLAAELVRALPGRNILFHENVPANDGGIALGQIWVAGALEKQSCA